MTDRYAVIGNPIAHSKSPVIHAAFARQTGRTSPTSACSRRSTASRTTVDAFAREGGQGLNVTVPFKLEAFALARECTERARLAGAVNTLKRRGDALVRRQHRRRGPRARPHGEPGRAVGRQRDRRARRRRRGARHPGAAARRAPRSLVISNRTVAKADALARRFSASGPIESAAPATLAGRSFDVVINATSFGLGAQSGPTSLAGNDLRAWRLRLRPHVAAASRRHSCAGRRRTARRASADGLGMLHRAGGGELPASGAACGRIRRRCSIASGRGTRRGDAAVPANGRRRPGSQPDGPAHDSALRVRVAAGGDRRRRASLARCGSRAHIVWYRYDPPRETAFMAQRMDEARAKNGRMQLQVPSGCRTSGSRHR